jgi:hypothetical protein
MHRLLSCVRLGCSSSSFFNNNVGVREGENLLPVPFSLFLNDLTEFLSHSYDGLVHSYQLSQMLFNSQQMHSTVVYYISSKDQ